MNAKVLTSVRHDERRDLGARLRAERHKINARIGAESLVVQKITPANN